MPFLDRVKHALSRRLVWRREVSHKRRSLWAIARWMTISRHRHQNREMVRLFRDLMVQSLGINRMTRICQRYRLNLDEMEKKGKPLKERHLAKMLAGAADIFTVDMEELLEDIRSGSSSFCDAEERKLLQMEFEGAENVRDLTIGQFTRLVDLLFPFKLYHPKKVARGDEILPAPTEWMALLFHDALLMDLERLALAGEVAKLQDRYAYFELLCKGLSYREMKPGMLIPAPMWGRSQVGYYKVAAQIVSWKGMVAYGLIPATLSMGEELDPILLFRGSAFSPAGLDALSTYITDLERHLGETAYTSGRGQLQEFVQGLQGRPVLVMGHSLGGSLAQWFTCENASMVKELITFNSPGLPRQVVENFLVTSPLLQPLPITIFRTKGDIVHRAGDQHLGHGCSPEQAQVTLVELHPKEGLKCRPHKSRFLHRVSCEVVECRTIAEADLQRKLTNYDHYGIEKMRKYGGAYVLAHVFRALRFFSRRLFTTHKHR